MADVIYLGDDEFEVRPRDEDEIGGGGEARVFDISRQLPGLALKLFRLPSDPYYKMGDAAQQRRNQLGAETRLAEYQEKLPRFPRNMPPNVIAPRLLGWNRPGAARDARMRGQKTGRAAPRQIIAYAMQLVPDAIPLKELCSPAFRKRNPIGNDVVTELFLDLHTTTEGVHAAELPKEAVIGDFNYLNCLAQLGKRRVMLVDADSMSYGGFECHTFTPRWVDPLICDPNAKKLLQQGSHSQDTDWYAYALMLWECWLRVHLYGGVYTPRSPAEQVDLDARPLARISVFHPQVTYPAKGLPKERLPDDVLHYYFELVTKDRRGPFPRKLLEGLRWVTCSRCGAEHARDVCPECAFALPKPLVKEVIRGRVSVEKLFATSGVILRVAFQRGKLRYLYYDDGKFRREDGSVVLQGRPSPDLRFRLCGDATLVALRGNVAVLRNGAAVDKLAVDLCRGRVPTFDANEQHYYWAVNGQLYRDDQPAPAAIGGVLRAQTRIWAGPRFGFGFYRAGDLQVAFTFDAVKRGINDSVKIPHHPGEILDAAAFFDGSRCWFLTSAEEQRKIVNRCWLIKRDGTVSAAAEAAEGDGSWLESIHGKAALTLAGPQQTAVHALLAATDRGIVRIEEHAGRLEEGASFPDTQGFVDSGDLLIPGAEGLYVVDQREIRLLKMR